MLSRLNACGRAVRLPAAIAAAAASRRGASLSAVATSTSGGANARFTASAAVAQVAVHPPSAPEAHQAMPIPEIHSVHPPPAPESHEAVMIPGGPSMPSKRRARTRATLPRYTPDPKTVSDKQLRSWLRTYPQTLNSYNMLIHLLGAKGRVLEAKDVFRDMQTKHTPNEATYAALINGAAVARDAQLADEFFQAMQGAGVQPTLTTYSVMIKALRHARSLKPVLDLLEDMKAKGVQLNEVVYTSVISACVMHKDYNKAWDIFGEMRYWNVLPDDITYTTMISSCAKAREAERALILFDEMRERRLEVGVEAYGAVLHACSLRHDMHVQAFRVYADMQRAGLACDERALGALLHSCGTIGNVKAAHTLWNRLTRPESSMYVCDPNVRMYNSLLKTYANAIRARVPEVLRRLTEREELVLTAEEAAVAARTESVDHLWAAPTNDACEQIAEFAPNTDATELVAQPDAKLAVREEYTVGELFENTTSLVASMRARGIAPNVFTLNRVLEAYAWGLQLSPALDLLSNMEEQYGVTPDRESYRLVIGACIKLDQINTAYDVFESMHSTLPGEVHDKGVYKHLIYGCMKVGAHQELLRVTGAMCEAGVVPAPEEFVHLRSTLLKQGREQVWDRVKAMCMSADQSHLWAIKDAQFRMELAKYKPIKMGGRHKRPFEK